MFFKCVLVKLTETVDITIYVHLFFYLKLRIWFFLFCFFCTF